MADLQRRVTKSGEVRWDVRYRDDARQQRLRAADTQVTGNRIGKELDFLDAGPHIDALAASPHLARLVSIEFYNKSLSAALGDSGLRTLVASPHLKKVAILSAPFNEIGLDGVEVLAASKELPALRHVVLAKNPVEDPTERCSFDAINLEVNYNSISLPPLGEALEAKYGRLLWLHSPSEFRMFPPDERDV